MRFRNCQASPFHYSPSTGCFLLCTSTTRTSYLVCHISISAYFTDQATISSLGSIYPVPSYAFQQAIHTPVHLRKSLSLLRSSQNTSAYFCNQSRRQGTYSLTPSFPAPSSLSLLLRLFALDSDSYIASASVLLSTIRLSGSNPFRSA